MDDLIERLRLIAAWHKPGGPTPKEGMPNRTKTCLEAADRIAALEADNARLMGLVKDPPKHKYWGAGEPDCPREIKAGNGELHTLRCKVCGEDSPRNPICQGAL